MATQKERFRIRAECSRGAGAKGVSVSPRQTISQLLIWSLSSWAVIARHRGVFRVLAVRAEQGAEGVGMAVSVFPERPGDRCDGDGGRAHRLGPGPINNTYLTLGCVLCESGCHADWYASGLGGDGGMVWNGL